MINPYQAPPETSGSAQQLGNPLAEFQLSARQIRYAESKFLLRRCGGRLTLASLVMIGLAIAVAFDLPGFPSAGDPGGWYQLSLVLRELTVMGFAAAVYLGLIYRVRRDIRANLRSHGIVDGADVMVQANQQQLNWTTSTGSYTNPLGKIELIHTGKGLILWLDPNLFLFVPRDAAFSNTHYRSFVRGLKQAMA
jgi:hypothetical protein